MIGLAIESVLDQSVSDFELLVVGDGCTDETASVVAGFADPRIRWWDLPKGKGFGYDNRNKALREAIGDLVAFMAHDDLWFADHLSLLAEAFHDEAVDFAYSRPLWVFPDGRIIPNTFNLNLPEVREPFMKQHFNAIPACCVVHRRACFDRVGYWNEALPRAGDLDMWVRILSAGGAFRFVSTPTALHFRANWRTNANPGPEEIKVWQDWGGEFLPPSLHLTVNGEETAQAVASQLLDSDPHWVTNLRSDAEAALDRLARNHVDLQLSPSWKRFNKARSLWRKLRRR